MIKVQKRLFYWLISGIILFIIIHLEYQTFSNIVLLFWLSIPIVDVISLFINSKIIAYDIEREKETIERNEFAQWNLQFKYRYFFEEAKIILSVDGVEEIILLTSKSDYQKPLIKLAVHTGVLMAPELAFSLESEFRFFNLEILMDKEVPGILVLPKIVIPEVMADDVAKMIQNHGRQLQKIQMLQEEFDYLDTLKPGEPIKHVHWKLSAKKQRFIVMRHKPPQRETSHLWVRLHHPHPDDKDTILDIASNLSQQWFKKGYQVSINQEKQNQPLQARIKLAQLKEKETDISFEELSKLDGLMLITDELDNDIIQTLQEFEKRRRVISVIVLNDQRQRASESLPNIQVIRVSDYEKK